MTRHRENQSNYIISLALCSVPLNALAVEATNASPVSSMLQVIAGLLVVLAVMAALAWLLKRFNVQNGSSSAVAKIVGGVSIGSRERVIVVEVADRWLVVGVAPGQVTSIANLEKSASPISLNTESTATTNPAQSFSKWLSEAMKQKK